MPHQFLRKLERLGSLSPTDKEVLVALLRRPLINLPKGSDLIRIGDIASSIRVLLSGWGLRYKFLPDGRRQILSLVLPADICEMNVFSSLQMDHSIIAAAPTVLAEISRDDLQALMARKPAIRNYFLRDLQLTIGLLQEAIVNIGQRTALERMANLFCELHARLDLIGSAPDMQFEFPLVQADLAAATGLSTVHVNRTLQELRHLQLITLSGKQLRILDVAGLRALALFNPDLVRLTGPSQTSADRFQLDWSIVG